MTLAELQHHLARAASGSPTDPALLAAVSEGPGAERRVDVYRGTVREVHLRAIATAFPVCVEVLGEEYWRNLMIRLAAPYRAVASDLAAYGGHVPALLAYAVESRRELSDFEYLPDLATLEWRVHRARYSPDEPPFDLDALAALPADRQSDTGLRLSRAVSTGCSHWPVDALWRAHRKGGETAGAGHTYYCVHRCRGFEPAVDTLDRATFDLLEAVGTGTTFAGLERDGGHDPARLLDAIRRGWVVGQGEGTCSTTAS